MNIVAGEVYEGPQPFYRDPPGWSRGKELDGSCTLGAALYTVVSVHELPKPYKPRVFYKLAYRTPDGEEYDEISGALRIATLPSFRKLLTANARYVAGYGPSSGIASKGLRA